MWKIIFGALLFSFCGMIGIIGWAGCSNTPQTCKTSNDCAEGFGCVRNICQRRCSTDFDCRDTDGKCINSYCGGIQIPDGGTQDTPATECRAGDRRDCYTGPIGTEGVGVCKQGNQECGLDGRWGECKGQILPTPEQCNGIDNDCNGKIDDNCGITCEIKQTRPCYTGPPDTKGVGPCKAGIETCMPGAKGGDKPSWGQCEGQVLPVLERCDNNIDDNCNGEVNEGCECKPGQVEQCQASNGCAGLRTCLASASGTKWSECTASKPSDETCDGLDNDCDGKIDNVKGTADPLKRKCSHVCFEGIETCIDGKWKNCDAQLPQPELCNNKDDDCDGRIDNIENTDKPLVKGCDTGQHGICKNGQMFCKQGKWGECIAPEPRVEQCNDLDDNCDGQVDEEVAKPCGDDGECIRDTLGVKKCVPK